MKINHQYCDQCGDAKFKWLEKKIHEKIKELEKPLFDDNSYEIELLESLLENEK